MLDNHVETQTNPNCLDRMSAVYTDPDIQRRLDLMMRYETRLHRMYQRAFQNLLVVRNMTAPNEPNPTNGQSAPPSPLALPEAEPAAQTSDPEPLPPAEAPAAQAAPGGATPQPPAEPNYPPSNHPNPPTLRFADTRQPGTNTRQPASDGAAACPPSTRGRAGSFAILNT
jgi:hypothetical protein